MIPALEISGLHVGLGHTDIVRGVDLTLARGQRLGLVGESGSGKTLTVLAAMGLLRRPLRVTSGAVRLGGEDLLAMSRRELDRCRGARMAMIYQDPNRALNPLMTVGQQIVEGIRLHEPVTRATAEDRAVQLLGDVGVPSPRSRLGAYPHEFSGGMRQRVMIAMALSCSPSVLLCDEPTTALDVTTQTLVMALLDRLCTEREVATVLITHDLAVAGGFCDEIAVMYAGQIVERTTTTALFTRPQHPYAAALLASGISLDTPVDTALPAIAGQPPSPQDVDAGCSFRNRCDHAVAACATPPLELRPVAGSLVRCVRAEELDLRAGPVGVDAERIPS
jgi:peptide/nickel transport system ATP-binding protein